MNVNAIIPPRGSAQRKHVLYPQTFESAGSFATETGSMLDQSGQTVTLMQSGTASEDHVTCKLANQNDAGFVGDTTVLDLHDTTLSFRSDRIAAGQQVLGLTGTFTSDADATAEDIRQGKTAYMNGVKITGTAVF